MPQPQETRGIGAARPQRTDLGALREAVAAIQGSRLERLDAPQAGQGGRRAVAGAPVQAREDALAGLPAPGLTEIHVDETRGTGPGAGFVLALASRLGASIRRPLLWAGASLAFRESGRFYPPGLQAFGFDPDALLLVDTRREEEALWVAEEAGRSGALAAVVLEVRGNPARLSLEGTRRLHVRARGAGVPLLLLRQAGRPEPTAAPLRLRVRAATAAQVPGLEALAAGPNPPIGHPVFCVAVEKSRDRRARRLFLEWNPDARRLESPRLADRVPGRAGFDAGTQGHAVPGAAVSPSGDGPAAARAARPVLAFPRLRERAGEPGAARAV